MQIINVPWNFSVILQRGHVSILGTQQASMELTSELNELKGGLSRNSGADTVGVQVCT